MKRLLVLLLVVCLLFSNAFATEEKQNDALEIVKKLEELTSEDLELIKTSIDEELESRAKKAQEEEKNKSADKEDNDQWIRSYFVDEFNEPTNTKYIAYSKVINGTFSNSVVKNETLKVKIIISNGYKLPDISFELYEYGRNKIRQGDYNGKVRGGDDTIEIVANMWSRLDLKSQYKESFIEMLKNNKTVKITFSSYKTGSSYLFSIDDTTGFEDALNWLTE